jgi:hypothetical protein
MDYFQKFQAKISIKSISNDTEGFAGYNLLVNYNLSYTTTRNITNLVNYTLIYHIPTGLLYSRDIEHNKTILDNGTATNYHLRNKLLFEFNKTPIPNWRNYSTINPPPRTTISVSIPSSSSISSSGSDTTETTLTPATTTTSTTPANSKSSTSGSQTTTSQDSITAINLELSLGILGFVLITLKWKKRH